jgi:hypothetical protein
LAAQVHAQHRIRPEQSPSRRMAGSQPKSCSNGEVLTDNSRTQIRGEKPRFHE